MFLPHLGSLCTPLFIYVFAYFQLDHLRITCRHHGNVTLNAFSQCAMTTGAFSPITTPRPSRLVNLTLIVLLPIYSLNFIYLNVPMVSLTAMWAL